MTTPPSENEVLQAQANPSSLQVAADIGMGKSVLNFPEGSDPRTSPPAQIHQYDPNIYSKCIISSSFDEEDDNEIEDKKIKHILYNIC